MASVGFGSVSTSSKKNLSPAVNKILGNYILAPEVVKENKKYKALDELESIKIFMREEDNGIIHEIIKAFKKVSHKNEVRDKLLKNFFAIFEERNTMMDYFGMERLAGLRDYENRDYDRGRKITLKALKKMFFYVLTKKYLQYRKVKPLNKYHCMYYKNEIFNEYIDDYTDFYENFILRMEEVKSWENEENGTNDLFDINDYLNNYDLFDVFYDAFHSYRWGLGNVAGNVSNGKKRTFFYGKPDGNDKIIYAFHTVDFLNSDIEKEYETHINEYDEYDEDDEDDGRSKKKSFDNYFTDIDEDLRLIFNSSCPYQEYKQTGKKPEIFRVEKLIYYKRNKNYRCYSPENNINCLWLDTKKLYNEFSKVVNF
jgi:hypothetical protein